MPRKQVVEELAFTLVLEPDEPGWHAHLPRVPGCRTRGRSLTEARRNVGEALSACEDVFPNAEAVARKAVLVEDVRLPGATRRKLSAYVQALADAGVNAQQAQALAGHADLAAHERYLRSSARMLTLPEAALPAIRVHFGTRAGSVGEGPDSQSSMKTGRGGQIRTADPLTPSQVR